jgi:hypothetical protein
MVICYNGNRQRQAVAIAVVAFFILNGKRLPLTDKIYF